ncbi:MAG: DNA polymerase/3'-5' exonuclease PolX [Verrucomicrobia bacterium]|nr:DNA polymerase/3'-5' exonuclease PolX [Verrucomicrobiota bacterium]
MDKHEVARILDEIAILLELKGENPFRVRAYTRAARTLESIDEELDTLVEEKRLDALPGIGEGIAEKIAILVKTGRLPYLEKLKKSTPPGLLELLKIPGLGAKKVKILYEKLKIKTVADLEKACRQGKIAKLKGFAAKTQENILNGITKLQTFGKRILLHSALKIAEPILKALSKQKEVKKFELGGSARRQLETVGDLDFVASSSSPAKVTKWFAKQPWVAKVLGLGATKATVQLQGGIQADLRVVSDKEYPFALLYFTGNKDHNIHLRQKAKKLKTSLSEYGFDPPLKKTPRSEEEIYKALGYHYIPPELREDTGELEIAAKKELPKLVDAKDIRGAFHCHTTDSDGHNNLNEMVSAAEDLGWEYIGISDHSQSSFQANGMDEDRLFDQISRIRKLKRRKIHVFAGLECDILPSGKLDFSDAILKELDFVIVSIHRSFNLSEKAMTARLIKAIENPYMTMVGHATGRLLLKRDPYAINLPKIIDACARNKKIIELNVHPMRLDMDWRYWKKAAEKGVLCCINPDAHRAEDLKYVAAGVGIARKGWLQKKDVFNTLPLAKVKEYLKR